MHTRQTITLIAPLQQRLLTPQWAAQLQHQLGLTGEVRWLSPGEACELEAESPVPELAKMLQTFIGPQPVDCLVQPSGNRLKKLLITDMDSTIIEQECIDELAAYAGLKEKVAAITERAMNGELEFKAALRERVRLLAGLPVSTLRDVFERHITFTPGAQTLVATMKAHGARCVLVSGGFSFFTGAVRRALGFDFDHSNTLLEAQDKLTGQVAEPILDKESKLQSLHEHCAALSIAPSDVLALGDGANDLPMLLASGLGIAYRAKPAVQAAAQFRLNHTDLTGALFAQGIDKHKFIA